MRKIFDNTAHIRLRYPHFQQKVGIAVLNHTGGIMIVAQRGFFIAENQSNQTFQKVSPIWGTL